MIQYLRSLERGRAVWNRQANRTREHNLSRTSCLGLALALFGFLTEQEARLAIMERQAMNSNTKVNRRTVMAEANALVKSANMNRSQALSQGWKVARIYAAFAAGAIATVTFLKADGTERVARALPAKTGEFLIKGTGTHTTPKANLLFVDSDIGEFRSLVKARIISVA